MPGFFSPPSINPHVFRALSFCLGHFLLHWSKDSLVLAHVVVRGWPGSEPDCQELLLVHLRPQKSYTGAIYLYATRLAPPGILNLIF